MENPSVQKNQEMGQENSGQQGLNQHTPVLIDKIIESLNLVSENKLSFNSNKGAKVFDGTFGGGGYSSQFLALGHSVWSCDLDKEALNLASSNEFLKQKLLEKKLILANSNFADYIQEFEDGFFDLIVLDLGFSSNQLEFSGRGFSYQKTNDPFDLRYDQTKDQPAYHKISTLTEAGQLRKIIYQNSGEEFSTRIAQGLFELFKERSNENLKGGPKVNSKIGSRKELKSEPKNETVLVSEVVAVIKEAIPVKFRTKTNAILSRVWQAIRIWVNDEFVNLELFLDVAKQKLNKDGLLMVVCFHSLEDKMVTNYFRKQAKPVPLDDFGNTQSDFNLLTKKAIVPDQAEIERNPRSRSATLRILQKN